MLRKCFKDQIYDVYRYIPIELHVCLVSATLPNEILQMTALVRILVKCDELTLEVRHPNFIKIKYPTCQDIYFF